MSVDTECVCSAWHKRWLIIVVQQRVAHGTAEGKTAWLFVSVVVVRSQRLKLSCLFVSVICWRATNQSVKLWRLSLLCAQGPLVGDRADWSSVSPAGTVVKAGWHVALSSEHGQVAVVNFTASLKTTQAWAARLTVHIMDMRCS
jgi:hypothetical protein